MNLLKKCGLPVSKVQLVHLNPEYVREGELSLGELFAIEDVTRDVMELMVGVAADMQQALEYLSAEVEPAGNCDCVYKGRSNHCTMFGHSNPNMPTYGVHDLTRIGASKKKLAELIDTGVYTIDDIPVDFELTEKQRNQADVYTIGKPMINPGAIRDELDKLEFPLYFFDYETYPCAIPRFDGFSPYNQIPIQYSLHILESAEAEPTHKEFLYVGEQDPSANLLAQLRQDIGPKGSVLAWHKSFEQGRNSEIANRIPDGEAFMEDMNNRMFDLEDIFTAQLHVHPGFKGKTSIKYVLPTLVPELSYKDLEIKEGGTASQEWNKIATNAVSDAEKLKIADNLKKYCKLDTYAMYAIWKHLHELE